MYKRQLRDCTLPLESVAAWRAGNYLPRYALAFIERMEPVSYTHLDVYKRQEQSRAAVQCDFFGEHLQLTAAPSQTGCALTRHLQCNFQRGMSKIIPEMCIRDRVYTER